MFKILFSYLSLKFFSQRHSISSTRTGSYFFATAKKSSQKAAVDFLLKTFHITPKHFHLSYFTFQLLTNLSIIWFPMISFCMQ